MTWEAEGGGHDGRRVDRVMQKVSGLQRQVDVGSNPGSVIVELDVPAQVIKHPPHQASVPSPVKWGE